MDKHRNAVNIQFYFILLFLTSKYIFINIYEYMLFFFFFFTSFFYFIVKSDNKWQSSLKSMAYAVNLILFILTTYGIPLPLSLKY